MDHFHSHNNELFAENIAVREIAKKYGTPCYIYSRATLERHWQVFDEAFSFCKHQICYAVKANSNINLLKLLADLGSGFDIVSGGELARVLKAGGKPQKILFSGIGKSSDEIQSALDVGIGCFNVESESELYRINEIAKQSGKTANISFRINPNIDAGTHPYITTGLKHNKFGVDFAEVISLYQKAKALPGIKIKGIGFHIGSQMLSVEPLAQALQMTLQLLDELQKLDIHVSHLDIGGGMGVRYHDENPPEPKAFAEVVKDISGNRSLEVMVEPGRAIAANAGILVTKVEYLKHSQHQDFAIVDAGMNDLIRPSLYSAYHDIIPVTTRSGEKKSYDIVGPVCESGDFFGKNRELCLQANDLLAIRTAGAYGFTMSSNYNSRPRAIEILVDGDECKVIRKRETVEDLFKLEE